MEMKSGQRWGGGCKHRLDAARSWGLFRTASSGTFLQHTATMLTGQQERFSQGDREKGHVVPSSATSGQ